MAALALAIAPGCALAYGQTPKPPVARCPDNAADAVAARFEIGGFSLDQSRSAVRSLLDGLAIVRQSARKFAGGGEELRVTLKDETFIRLAFPADGDTVRPRAIIYSAGVGGDAAALLAQLVNRLGPAVWKDAKTVAASHRLIWGGRGEPEAGIAPSRCSAIVVEMVRAAGQAPTVTIAQAGWFQSKGG